MPFGGRLTGLPSNRIQQENATMLTMNPFRAARIYQILAAEAHNDATGWLAWGLSYASQEDRKHAFERVEIGRQNAADLYRKARTVMGIEESRENALIRAGQIEAFEFAARQFRTYASDNDILAARYGLHGKHLLVSEKRTQTWNDAAEDCERVAAHLRKDVE